MRGITVATPPKKKPQCATTPHRERKRQMLYNNKRKGWKANSKCLKLGF